MESFEELPADNDQILGSLATSGFELVASDSTLGVWDYTPSCRGHATHGSQYVLIGSTSFILDFYMNGPVGLCNP